jgi:cobalt-zinc-cadmium efflux system membrane fusion protein
MFVTARIETDKLPVTIAVRAAAVQSLRGQDVVFVQEGEAFEARPVTRGRFDGEWVEVLSGVTDGEHYVAAGSFVLKSELLASEASHEH